MARRNPETGRLESRNPDTGVMESRRPETSRATPLPEVFSNVVGETTVLAQTGRSKPQAVATFDSNDEDLDEKIASAKSAKRFENRQMGAQEPVFSIREKSVEVFTDGTCKLVS